MNEHHDYPLLSLFFTLITIISWFFNKLDLSALDNGILLPVMHMVTIGSGITAICLGAISMRDKYKKWRANP